MSTTTQAAEAAPKFFIILGAHDPEAATIEEVARLAGVRCGFVTRGGKRVLPHEAKNADGTSIEVPEGTRVIWVECRPAAGVPEGDIIVDHHGDAPQASWGPEQFWEASSLGQVVEILRGAGFTPWMEEIPQEILFEAANDHCKWAAATGQCPGVDAEAFKVWVGRRYAEFNGWNPESFAGQVAEAEVLIAEASSVDWLPGNVADLSTAPVPAQIDPTGPFIQGLHYATHIATLRGGRACVVSAVRKTDRARGLQINGAGEGTPAGREPVDAFLAHWRAMGYTAPNVYGDPVRGHAGVWLKE